MKLVVFAALLTASAVSTSPTRAAPKEVVTLILVDALRPDHMGAYGYAKPTTPNLDAFAKEGTLYTRAYVNAPWTRPSTASFLTGLNASRHRTETHRDKLPASIRTVAQHLKERGYTTAGFVANGNGGSLAGLEKGFDVFHDPSNTYTKAVRGKTYNGLPTGPFLVERALDWLEKTKADKVFLFLFLVDPHDPYQAPPELEKMFLGNYNGKVRRRALWEINNDYPEPERQSMIAAYDAAIRYSDQALGTLFRAFKRMGIYDKTTFYVTADHGEGFGEHGFYLHAHHFWDEVVRVPLIAKGPGFAPGVDGRLTQAIDVSRTIVQAAGASGDLPGNSLLDPAPNEPRVISEYNEFGIHRQAIIGDRYKVIWQRPADEAWYLREAKKQEYFPSVSFDREVIRVFDMTNDPGERHDLANNMPPEAQRLLTELRQFVASKDQ